MIYTALKCISHFLHCPFFSVFITTHSNIMWVSWGLVPEPLHLNLTFLNFLLGTGCSRTGSFPHSCSGISKWCLGLGKLGNGRGLRELSPLVLVGRLTLCDMPQNTPNSTAENGKFQALKDREAVLRSSGSDQNPSTWFSVVFSVT